MLTSYKYCSWRCLSLLSAPLSFFSSVSSPSFGSLTAHRVTDTGLLQISRVAFGRKNYWKVAFFAVAEVEIKRGELSLPLLSWDLNDRCYFGCFELWSCYFGVYFCGFSVFWALCLLWYSYELRPWLYGVLCCIVEERLNPSSHLSNFGEVWSNWQELLENWKKY
jgi:hypothetical protein